MKERFWSTLKREAVDGRRFKTIAEARRVVFEYIEVFYNRKRRHSLLGYVSPERVEGAVELNLVNPHVRRSVRKATVSLEPISVRLFRDTTIDCFLTVPNCVLMCPSWHRRCRTCGTSRTA